MKKVFAIVAVAGLFVVTSCKGDYNCDCTYGGFTQTYAQYINIKKSDGETSCNAAQTSLQIIDPSASCTLNKQ
jgi:hypothetical protein